MTKHCVITGAADGIGRALALRYAIAGYQITGLDVDATRSAKTEAECRQLTTDVQFMESDLTNMAELNQTISRLHHRPPIDLFIHNAGISAVGPFQTIDTNHQQTVIKLNLLAPMLLTSKLLCDDLLTPNASFVFMASLSHFTGYPGATTYAASKDGLVSYARSLSVSLAKQGIHVLTVYPGPTRTEHARRYSPDNSREQSRMPPDTLADLIYQAVLQRQRLLIPGIGNKLFAMVGYYFPQFAEFAMRRLIFEKLTTTS